MMKASMNAIKLIQDSEGFRAKPYLCPAGVPTIGYGSTIYENGTHVKLSDPEITEERAVEILFDQLKKYENAVNRYVHVPINQNQFDALVDFAYNAGAGNLQRSTLLRKLNAGDYEGASHEFGRWVYGGGKKLNGLVKRREAERNLFMRNFHKTFTN
jgi:lysozyme